jgi:6-phosphofructokinase 1
MELVMEGKFGRMVAYRHPEIVDVSLEEAVRAQNLVDPKGQLVHTAKGLGIEFGQG